MGDEQATLLVNDSVAFVGTDLAPASGPIERTVCWELANWWIPTVARLVVRPIRDRRDRTDEESGGNYQIR